MMDTGARGRAELRLAMRHNRGLMFSVMLFSSFINLLMLTGPIFMLQVYDRVLGSRSEETLLALALLMAFMFLMMGLLDYVRGRVLARMGARLQMALDARVFSAVLRKAALATRPEQVANAVRDLEVVQRFIASPAFAAIFDIPWTPVFLAGILVFHPWLGYLALVGGGLLVLISVLNQLGTSNPGARARLLAITAERRANELRNEAEMVRALGMSEAGFARWRKAREEALRESLLAGDRAGRYMSLTRTFRMFLQSAMLGLGAYLVLQNQVTPGAMIAASILLGRALAPIDLLVNQWPMLQQARESWRQIAALLGEVPPEAPRTTLPRPRARLTSESLTVIPPGQSTASLRMVNFELKPGQAMGVIGPSGAGKSTLARTITGVWRPAGGKIRLDGASLDQFSADALGKHVGYLPQRVQMFDGTVAENIAGLDEKPAPEAVVAAARKADAHNMILHLPEGYDTRIASGGGLLSGGQLQRIGLARAMYGDPVLVVLDEPNSNLDNEGNEALNRAIRELKAEGRAVLIMAHRPAAIKECDLLLVLDHGTVRAFGPRDEVLHRTVRNAAQIRQMPAMGGVT